MNPSTQRFEETRRFVLAIALFGVICCASGGAMFYFAHSESQTEGGQSFAPPPKGPVDEFFRGFHGSAFLMVGLGFALFVSAIYFDRRSQTPKRGFFVHKKAPPDGPGSLRPH